MLRPFFVLLEKSTVRFMVHPIMHNGIKDKEYLTLINFYLY